jgi:glycerate kinase
MKVLIACDAFKDALSAPEGCEAIARGLQAGNAEVEPLVFPLGDGGEGTSEVLTYHSGGQMISLQVNDPLYRTVEAQYGLSGDQKTAYIEMAAASGLQLLKQEERNPLLTSSYGTGELIRHALEQGAQRIVLCIGGSATNDAGMGMAAALGYRFLSDSGELLHAKGEHLGKVAHIDKSHLSFDLSEIEVITLCDVDNPLHGPSGAAHVFAPQKGADEEAVAILDEGLQHFGEQLGNLCGKNVAEVPGAGAAGGLGGGSMAFLGARLQSGIQTVMDISGFSDALQSADVLITGEGQLDAQTKGGKLIKGVAAAGRQQDIPVIALCGSMVASLEDIADMGLAAAFSIQNRPVSLTQALVETEERLEGMAAMIARLVSTKMPNSSL